jgi:hypothetical protein
MNEGTSKIGALFVGALVDAFEEPCVDAWGFGEVLGFIGGAAAAD